MIAVVLGVGVGLSLGALGGGGSTLAVPVLVFVAGMSAQDATSSSLLVVGVASLLGAAGHHRLGNVHLGTGVAFGLAGIAGSSIGTLVNRSLNQTVLLMAFAALIMFVAVRMYSGTTPPPPELDPSTTSPSSPLAHQSQGATLVAAPPRPSMELTARAAGRLGLAATGVGLLTGLFGVGGGFVVVPALTMLLGFSTRHAVGTSLVVIAVNAAVALLMRSADLALDWPLVISFLGAVTLGVLWGTRVCDRIDARQLTRAFALLLGAVALYTAIGAVVT